MVVGTASVGDQEFEANLRQRKCLVGDFRGPTERPRVCADGQRFGGLLWRIEVRR